jgi:hypothetical protein
MQYIASYGDLIAAIGADEHAAAAHYILHGRGEGRARDAFDAAQYLANYADLRAAFGTDQPAATRHFIDHGFGEGRTDDALGSPAPSDFNLTDADVLAAASASSPQLAISDWTLL